MSGGYRLTGRRHERDGRSEFTLERRLPVRRKGAAMQKFIAAMACLGALALSACEPTPGKPAQPKTGTLAPAWR
jgi:hypothetical protein